MSLVNIVLCPSSKVYQRFQSPVTAGIVKEHAIHIVERKLFISFSWLFLLYENVFSREDLFFTMSHFSLSLSFGLDVCGPEAIFCFTFHTFPISDIFAHTHLKSEFFWKVKNFLVFQEILGKSRKSWKVRKFLEEKSENFWKVRKIVKSQKIGLGMTWKVACLRKTSDEV